MKFVTKVGDILNLDNGEHFQVVKCFEYENQAYLFIMSIPEEFEDIFDNSKKTFQIVREVVTDNSAYLEEIKDKELLKKLEQTIKIAK